MENKCTTVKNIHEWRIYGWFTEKELENADAKGLIGNRYGINCYISRFII